MDSSTNSVQPSRYYNGVVEKERRLKHAQVGSPGFWWRSIEHCPHSPAITGASGRLQLSCEHYTTLNDFCLAHASAVLLVLEVVAVILHVVDVPAPLDLVAVDIESTEL